MYDEKGLNIGHVSTALTSVDIFLKIIETVLSATCGVMSLGGVAHWAGGLDAALLDRQGVEGEDCILSA